MEAQNLQQQPMAEAVKSANDISTGYVLAKRAVDIDLRELTIDQSSLAFKALLRNIVNPAVDALWAEGEVRSLLDKFGGIAGTSQFAHCLFSMEIYQSRRDDFEGLAKQSKREVTLKLIWDMAHDYLKKYGVVFRSGWVEGTRSDHIKAD